MATKIAFEGKRELRWLEIGQCLACYIESEVELSDQLWDDWMDAIRRDSITSLLICSWGPTQPSHQQWRRATRMMRDRQLAVAVITDARHNFALAKAAAWLGTNIAAHRWDEVGAALDFIGMPQANRLSAKASLVALRDRFGSVVTEAEYADIPHSPVLSSTPISDAQFSASSEMVFEANDEIQRKLAEVQARLTARAAAVVQD